MSDIPFVKDFDFAYGEPAQLSPLVRRVIANNPGPFTYTGSGAYLVGAQGRPSAVIDPGPDDDQHLDAIMTATGGAISHILITHTHHDHCGGARKLADRCGAPIYGFGPHPVDREAAAVQALEEGGDTSFAPDHLIGDGAAIEGDGWTLNALHTPGHISNHLCFCLDAEKALFTGDHIMGWATTVIIPPAGHMGDYFNSLEKLLALDSAIYYPTHGAPIENPHRFVRAVRTHRRIRDGQIIEQLKNGKSEIPDMVAAMYRDIDKRLHGAAAMNVLAHLIRLVEDGVVAADGPAGLKSVYRLA